MSLSDVEARLELQLIKVELMVNAAKSVTNIGNSNTASQGTRARLDYLKETWEDFLRQHHAIIMAIRDLGPADKSQVRNHVYFSEQLYLSTHDCYLAALGHIDSIFEPPREPITESLRQASSTHSVSDNPTDSNNPTDSTSQNPPFYHHARLPRIDLPKFNGSQTDWLSFKDLFNLIVITNPTLTSVEKLQYLKTSPTGSAALLLKNTTLTSDNFQKAWDALVSFYENTRLLVNEALQALFTLKHMTKESASEMEQLYTNIMQIHRTLETLQRPVQYWDDVLVFTAVQRLDSESVKAWEHQLGAVKQPPTWDQFSDFLLSRLRSLQAVERNRQGKSTPLLHKNAAKSKVQGKSNDDTAVEPNPCLICSSNHYIAHCPQYISKAVTERMAIIRQYKLCSNCLRLHRTSLCRTTTRCWKCGGKHHTTIHQTYESTNEADATTTPPDSAIASTSTSTDA